MISGMQVVRDRTGLVVWLCKKCRAEAEYRTAMSAAGTCVEAHCPVCNQRLGEWRNHQQRDQELRDALQHRNAAA